MPPANKMGANKKLDHALAASMAVVISGMEWTQTKNVACKLAEVEDCLVCGECGTSLHRRTSCLGVLEKEGAEEFAWVREIAKNYLNGPHADHWQTWLQTGLRHPPFAPLPRGDTSYCGEGVWAQFDNMSIYIDGSTYNGRWKDIARCGLGVGSY